MLQVHGHNQAGYENGTVAARTCQIGLSRF
jgi:hypothetical protein